jgi:hypothetical protein
MSQPSLCSVFSGWKRTFFRNHLTRIWQGFTILVFVISLVGVPTTVVHALDYTWTAYNDCSGTNSITNTTNILGVSGSGTLKNFGTGAALSGVTATFTSSGGPVVTTSTATGVASGTDAYNTFDGKANIVGGVQYGSSGWYEVLTISGLDTARAYTFATSANRAGGSTYANRITRFTISSVDGATNASTSGTTIKTTAFTKDTTTFSTGENTSTGYVARWTGIQPGSDGTIVVRAEADTSVYQAYGMSVFILAEEAGTAPTVTTTSSTSNFASNIGVTSAEQSYTVAGVNLTNGITITAPVDFEISRTSGSGFASTITLPQSSGTVAATTIYVHFMRTTAGTSSGNITHVSSGATQVNVAVRGTASNGAPTIMLVQPTDGASGVDTSPAVSVKVTDPDADSTSVSFYGRPAGTGTGSDFMLVLIPDPQNESQYEPDMLASQTNWIVNNKTTDNIVYVTATGDMVNDSASTAEYANADAAVDILDTGSVWYTMATGNHDIDNGTTYYANYFGHTRYADREAADGYWFGGYYDDYNTYSLFSASGMDFILINLQYSPTTDILHWADTLLTTYSSRRAIVEQHDMLNPDNSWENQATYDALRGHGNLFLMLCGHMHTEGDGAAYLAGTGTDGHTIHVVLADYQDINEGNGYLRLFRFSPANGQIYMTTYSPYTDESITSTANYDQGNLAYDMGSSGAYSLIGTVSSVVSGSNASLSWSGLSSGIKYEWYAVVSDGTSTTTSPTWSFTTGAATSTYTIQSTATAGGSISPSGAVNVPSGADQIFTITPETGDHVADVLVDGVSVGAVTSYTFNAVTASHTIVANFAADTHTVTFDLGAHGTRTGGGEAVQSVISGADATAPTFSVEPGWTFTGWDKSFTNVTSDLTITAQYSPITFTISASAGIGGSISPSGTVGITSGADLTFSIIPAGGYQVMDVLVDGVSAGAVSSYTFKTVTANHTIAASFITIPPTQFSITATAGEHGSINPSGVVNVTAGTDQTFTIAPATGYHVADVLVDGASVGAVTSYTFRAIAASHSIAASFSQNTYTLTINKTGSGTVAVDKAGPYLYGDSVTLTATTAAGWAFTGWSACTGTGTCTVTMDADKTITATFTQVVLTLSTSVVGSGSITLDKAGPYHYGDIVTFTAVPASDWAFSAWGGALSGSANPTSITMDTNQSVSATFVDAKAPDTTITSTPSNPSSVSTATFAFTGTDNVTADKNLTFECSLDNGSWTSCTSAKTYSGLANSTHTFQVRAKDAAGNMDATPASFTWTVSVITNHPPVANAGGPYSGNEGTPLSLSAAKSTDVDNNITLYQWDLDNDGQFDDATGKAPKFLAVDNGTYTVRVLVTDAGGLTSTSSATVVIKNVAPTVKSSSLPNLARVRQLYAAQVVFSDPGTNDTFTATWNWGDGSSSTGNISSFTVTGSHTYTKIGTYTAIITITDKDGGVLKKSWRVIVSA